jgi:ribose 5-phosphate isomerase A
VSEEGSDNLRQVAERALRYVKPGHTLGLGTGRAAAAFFRALAQSGLQVCGVPTSKASEDLARELGIEIVGLAQAEKIDTTFDGADEVDPRLNLIKGFGGALVRERVVAMASRRRVMLVGEEKLVTRLGERGRIPVEVVEFAVPFCLRQLKMLGMKPALRTNDDGSVFHSDNGNPILDCGVKPFAEALRLQRQIMSIPGVIGTGLFLGTADVVLVGRRDGSVQVMNRVRPG